MKCLNFLIILLIVGFYSCGNDPENSNAFCEDTSNLKTFNFQSSNELSDTLVDWSISFPDCFEQQVMQGIDSNVGEFKSTIDDVAIRYDIGYLAGVYVNENNKTVMQSTDFEVWYELIDTTNNYYFSVPDLNANFFTTNQDLDELKKIFETIAMN